MLATQEKVLSDLEKQQINEYLKEKGLPTDFGVTFSDVTLTEHYSNIRTRSEIKDFKTRLSENFELGIPLISANMECVTGYELSVHLQREGGLAFLPQSLNIDQRIYLIDKIKRTDSALIENPLTIYPEQTLAEAKEVMDEYGIHSLIVINKRKELVGILSNRDWKYETDLTAKVKDLMTKGKLTTGKKGMSLEKAATTLRKNKLEKIPLLDEKGKLSGLITAHGLFYKQHYPNALRDEKGQFLIGGTIGVGKTFTKNHLKEVELQLEHGMNILLIDTARAYSVNTQEALLEVKKRYPKLTVVVGNVSTPEGAKFLFENGADVVKVNQGRGHACRTSEIGIGVPQVTAIAKASVIARNYNKTIIADGGMKLDGDYVKAIAAGADALMSGYLFIKCKESAAYTFYDSKGRPVKNYEGSASLSAQLKRMNRKNLDYARRPEGVTEEVPVIGTTKEVVTELIDAFKSSMSYQGYKNLSELRQFGKFEMQSKAGLFEGVKK